LEVLNYLAGTPEGQVLKVEHFCSYLVMVWAREGYGFERWSALCYCRRAG
jgi:hypothetical protein